MFFKLISILIIINIRNLSQVAKRGPKSKWKAEFPEMLIEEMAKGYSIEAFCGKIGISIDTFYRWETEHPQLSEAKKLGICQSQLFWERAGMAGMFGKTKGFNATVWIFSMKNRFGWRDKKDVDFTDKTLHEQILDEIEKAK